MRNFFVFYALWSNDDDHDQLVMHLHKLGAVHLSGCLWLLQNTSLTATTIRGVLSENLRRRDRLFIIVGELAACGSAPAKCNHLTTPAKERSR
jgi:hypothetical protein